MLKRFLLALALLGLFAAPAHAMRNSVYYEFGFTKTGPFISTRTDSIPFGATFKTHWIPCMGARLIKFNMRASTADSDSVVTVKFANADTIAGLAVAIDTSSTTAGSLSNASFLPGVGVHVVSNYVGSGGVSWDPANARLISVVPFVSTTAIFPYIPQRWVRFTVVAPSRQCTQGASGQACNSMHAVRIWVEVMYDGENTGQEPTYPFSGPAGF